MITHTRHPNFGAPGATLFVRKLVCGLEDRHQLSLLCPIPVRWRRRPVQPQRSYLPQGLKPIGGWFRDTGIRHKLTSTDSLSVACHNPHAHTHEPVGALVHAPVLQLLSRLQATPARVVGRWLTGSLRPETPRGPTYWWPPAGPERCPNTRVSVESH